MHNVTENDVAPILVTHNVYILNEDVCLNELTIGEPV
jgi:hypothetical protein